MNVKLRLDSGIKESVGWKRQILPVEISIDTPVAAPQPLKDSLTLFLNETLYAFFDDGNSCHLPFETVFSKEVKQLAKHYKEAYKPYYNADNTDVRDFNYDCLDVKLATQNDIYVTYQVNSILYGEGVETTSDWVTFVKSDGHRLKELITDDDMLRFYKEHPEQRNANIWENVQYQLSDGGDIFLACNTGLLNDSVAHQYVYATGIFEDVVYPIDAILPYLSKEAQALIKENSKK